MKPIGAWGRQAALTALVLVLLAVPALPEAAATTSPAGVEDFTFESFEADYYLGARRAGIQAHPGRRDDRRAVPARPEQGDHPRHPERIARVSAEHPDAEHRRTSTATPSTSRSTTAASTTSTPRPACRSSSTTSARTSTWRAAPRTCSSTRSIARSTTSTRRGHRAGSTSSTGTSTGMAGRSPSTR